MDEPTRRSQAPAEAAEGGGGGGGGGGDGVGVAAAEPQQLPEAGGGIGAEEEELLVAKAQSLMDRITAAADNPSPTVLQALASLLESQESRYILALSLACALCFLSSLRLKHVV